MSTSTITTGADRSARARLLSLMLEAQRAAGPDTRTIRPRARTGAAVPLSFSQERLWFLQQLGLAGAAYNVPLALRLSGVLAEGVLARALNELVRRHESLRTRFDMRDGVPHQIVDAPQSLRVERIDLSVEGDSQAAERALKELMHSHQMHVFDLSQEPPFRTLLVKLSAREHVLLLNLHHIATDGWSSGILTRELGSLYAGYIAGNPKPLGEPELQYADFAHWQRQQPEQPEWQAHLNYWRAKLAGAPPQLELPTDRPRPAVETYRGSEWTFDLPAEVLQRVQALARASGATPFMVALATFQILLSRWTGARDIVVGAPIAGRRFPELESLVGCFVNTLALRTDVDPDLSFGQLLKRVMETTFEAYAHQDLPFEALVRDLRPERDLSHQPVFQVLIAWQNYPEEAIELPGLNCHWTGTESATTHLDLSLYLYERQGCLSCVIAYSTDLFDATSIERFAGHFRTLLELVTVRPEIRVGDLELLAGAERAQILEEWNRSEAPFPDRCVHELFIEQAARTPRAPALAFEGQELSYGQLRERSGALARALRARGVQPDDRVAVFVERGLEMVVALLGCLEAGGAYVPIDPTYPTERVQHMLTDSAPKVVLTQAPLRGALGGTDAQIVLVDGDVDEETATEIPPGALTPRHLAYVIYTSGSTGKPKGVLLEHRGVVNFLTSMQQRPGLTPDDALLAITTICFDIAALELFLPLVTGAKVVLASREAAADATRLDALIDTHRVTVMQATPATWQLLLNGGWSGNTRLKALCGGEALSSDLARRLLPRVASLWNLYGPTETTIWSCCRRVEAADERPAAESIGRPIANTQIYILDEQRRPVPIGVTGEIYIGGAGVARGYHRRPELTAERFVRNPFDAAATVYRTGDVGRWLPDGSIAFLGRNDQQVKIRGFRIELGEIESRMIGHPAVREGVVVAREDVPGDRRLVAYFSVTSGETVTADALRAHLRAGLPEYMVPAAFVELAQLPTTPNGKIDRRALPAPSRAVGVAHPFEAARGPIEQQLATIWQSVLHVEAIGRHDNFFELGGHSLSAMSLIAEVNRRLGASVSPIGVFQCPTIARLGALIQAQQKSAAVDSSALEVGVI